MTAKARRRYAEENKKHNLIVRIDKFEAEVTNN